MKIVGTAIIFNEQGEILIGKRPEGKALAGLWEFPGGKQEQGESIEQCIVREIKEELDIDCEVGKYLMSVERQYEHGDFKLMVYEVKVHDFTLMVAKVHQELKFVKVADLNNYSFPEADIEINDYLMKRY